MLTATLCSVTDAGRGGRSVSEKRILPAFLLCFFFGAFGFHRFYVGKIGTGVLQVLTLGGLGIWALVDFVMIIVGAFTDKQGNKITQWT
jgi:TM2 domain-containing membrane protein YozV